MEKSKYYLVIGTFFQEKSAFGIGFDSQEPEIGEKVYVTPVVEPGFFSGIIDMPKRGGFFDEALGFSSIKIISFAKEVFGEKGDFCKEKLVFSKVYESKPDVVFTYEVFTSGSESEPSVQEWFGTWKYDDLTTGLVRLKTIATNTNFFDHEIILENLDHSKSLGHDVFESENVTTMCVEDDEAYLQNADPDDLPF